MTLGEARERRARIIRVHGLLTSAFGNRLRRGFQDRRWMRCLCANVVGPFQRRCSLGAHGADDVALVDSIPVAMCSDCRAARSPEVEFETLEDLAVEFLADIERLLPGGAAETTPQGDAALYGDVQNQARKRAKR